VYHELGKAIAVLGSSWIPCCRRQDVSYACGINAPLDELRARPHRSRGYEDHAKDRAHPDGPIFVQFLDGDKAKTRTSSSVPRQATLLVT
jgi:hypothetical protein